MLLLAYLMTRNAPWGSASIRVIAVNYETESQETIEHLTNILNEVRIEAEPKIVMAADIDKIASTSADASLVILPFRLWKNRLVGPVDGQIDELLIRLQTTALVMAAEDIDLDAEPEEGIAAEMAAAQDAMDEANKKLKEAEKDADKAREIADKAKENLLAFKKDEAWIENQEELSRLEAEIQKDEIEAEKAFRRAAKAKAKAMDAEKNAEAMGVIIDSEKDPSFSDN